MVSLWQRGATFSFIIMFKKMVPLDKREPFSKMDPWEPFWLLKVKNGAALKKALFWLLWGTVFPTKKGKNWPPFLKWHCFGASMIWLHFEKRHHFQSFFSKRLHITKRSQNNATKGSILQTGKCSWVQGDWDWINQEPPGSVTKWTKISPGRY